MRPCNQPTVIVMQMRQTPISRFYPCKQYLPPKYLNLKIQHVALKASVTQIIIMTSFGRDTLGLNLSKSLKLNKTLNMDPK